MTHKCTFNGKGWCNACDCTKICPKCGHKGMDTVGRCRDDSTSADKIWCPKCDCWRYISIRTGDFFNNDKEEVWIEQSMSEWGNGVEGEDGIIRMKKPDSHLHVVKPEEEGKNA